MTKQNCSACKCAGTVLIAIILLASIILSAIAGYYGYKNYQLEILRSGGKENFQAMNKFYASEEFVNYVTISQAEQLAMFAQQQGPQGWEENVPGQPTAQNATLDQITIQSLRANGRIKGDENARITILEFADVNCGYCKRQIAQSRTIQTLMESHPEVNMIYKNMPVLGSIEQAQVIECAGDQVDTDTYYEIMEEIYAANDTSLDNLSSIAASFGANKNDVIACVQANTHRDFVNIQMQEGRSFNIGGTPASVIINNETGEWELIEGAYPISEFERVLQLIS